MAAQPFTLDEQYAFTDGLCHLFAMAAQPTLGGQPTVLNATDPRQLEQHDWPEGEPLHLHVFLLMPDGSVVDAEGRRSVAELLHSFGVKANYSYELLPDPTWQHFRKPEEERGKAWLALIADRVSEQGWTSEDVPTCQNRLAKPKDFQAARENWTQKGLPRYEEKVNAFLDQLPPPLVKPPRRRTP